MLSLAFLVDVIADNRYDYREYPFIFFFFFLSAPKWENKIQEEKVKRVQKISTHTKKYPIYIRTLLS